MAKEKSETKGKKGRLSRERKQEVLGVLLVLLSLLVLASLVSYSKSEPSRNWTGPVGYHTAWGLFRLLGFPAFVVPLLGLGWGWNRFRNKTLSKPLINTLLLFGVVLSAILFLSLPDFSRLREAIGFEPGGWAGRQLATLLIGWIGYLGTIIVTSGILLVTFLVTTEVNIQRHVTKVTAPVKGYFSPEAREARDKAKQDKAKAEAEEKARKEREKAEKAKAKEAAKPEKPIAEKPKEEKGRQEDPGLKTAGAGKETGRKEAKPVPAVEGVPAVDAEYREGFLECLQGDEGEAVAGEDKSLVLTSKLAEFGVEGKVLGRLPGPIITRYEFQPAPGIKISQVMNLADDLALALKAQRIRIVGPIPGRGAVGVEIPNEKRSTVRLKSVLTSPAFEENPSPIQFALGKDTTGQPFCADLGEMPHLLVAGATGSGKSVTLNALIASILFRASPQEVHFIMIDPKRIELSAYRGIPHLKLRLREEGENGGGELEGVVTSSQEVVRVFRLAVNLMDERYQLLAKLGARNIEDYNKREEVPKKLPYLVIVVDELADLMLSREASEIENQIAKLAQMARAVGIHLVVATQRPSVDVITGVIKANFPCRIAFQVASKTDSRTILDVNGAESLLGRGDMLFLPPAQAEPIRLHGTYISAEEVGNIVGFLKDWYGVEEGEEDLEDHSLEVAAPEERDGERDLLFEEAKALIIRHQFGSTSLLQRRLKVGYSRAGRLMDQLEQAGIVGPFDGSKARKVLVKLDGTTHPENAN